MSNAAAYELLPWDSEAFGFPVASATAPRDRDSLIAALDAARQAGIRLVYVRSTDAHVVSLGRSLAATPISDLVTFVRDIGADDVPGAEGSTDHIVIERWPREAGTDDLLLLAREAGRFSRFRIDSKVPVTVFERIYDAWIANSVSGLIADEVLVTRDHSGVTGLVTVGTKNGRGQIGLLAVREDARGLGLGRALVGAALNWAKKGGIATAQVVTQSSNVAACRLYESSGYQIERLEHVFHFWL